MFFDELFDFDEFDKDCTKTSEETKQLLNDALNFVTDQPKNVKEGCKIYWNLQIDDYDFGPREAACKEDAIISFLREGLTSLKDVERKYRSILINVNNGEELAQYFLNDHYIEEEPAPSIPMCY